jgi:hypothetical protein
MSSGGKSMRLKFKGDSKTTNKKSSSKKRKSGGTGLRDDGQALTEEEINALEGWASAESFDHLLGPIMIVSGSTEPPSALVTSLFSFNLVGFSFKNGHVLDCD